MRMSGSKPREIFSDISFLSHSLKNKIKFEEKTVFPDGVPDP
jgi:hypothetical protein